MVAQFVSNDPGYPCRHGSSALIKPTYASNRCKECLAHDIFSRFRIIRQLGAHVAPDIRQVAAVQFCHGIFVTSFDPLDEVGIRFLSDYLEGDPYYRTHRPGQNLDRARAQLALVAALQAAEDEMRETVRRVARFRG